MQEGTIIFLACYTDDMNFAWLDRSKQIALLVFAAGILAAVILVRLPATQVFYRGIENDGIFGALVAGVLYAISFTAPSATVIFVNLTSQIHPFTAAIVGGFGALLYDLLIFTITRRQSHSRFIEAIKERLPGRLRFPKWAPLLAGMIILASPLPDELAAGMLGLSTVSARKFFLISFAMNTAGIFILLVLR